MERAYAHFDKLIKAVVELMVQLFFVENLRQIECLYLTLFVECVVSNVNAD